MLGKARSFTQRRELLNWATTANRQVVEALSLRVEAEA